MDDTAHPRLRTRPAASGQDVRGAVLVLHGGRERSRGRVTPLQLAHLRMVPFARDLHRHGARRGVAVHLLQNRYRGWNAPDLDPVQDARWALAELRRLHGRVPVVLVGHSMGGRVALRVADDDDVVAVVGLAPWCEPGEPVTHVAGRALLIAHGDRDRTTDPRLSLDFARRARAVTDRVVRFDVAGDGHAMLRRAGRWTRLTTDFALGALGTQPVDPLITNAWGTPSPEGLHVPL